MVSGRGLGHTGGTLDKLESIPGFRIDLDLPAYKDVLRRCGLVMIGQTAEIAPADKFLYALRDATATVESIPLIAASIMSKKLAEGIDGLVLDVKTGGGAFMERFERRPRARRDDVRDRPEHGQARVALITRMDQPLGRAVGNAVEVAESLECLRGEGPVDLMELSIELAAEMIVLGERAGLIDEASDLPAVDRRRPRPSSGSGGWSRPRGAIRGWSTTPRSCRPRGGGSTSLRSRTGYRPEPGGAADRPRHHAAGRRPGTDRLQVDPAVGVILHKKSAMPVRSGKPLCTLLVNDESRLESRSRTLIPRLIRWPASP